MANIETIQVGTATYSVYDASAVHTQYTHPNPVTAGTAGSSSNSSGKTLAVPYIKYNANGHVTESGTHTHTISSLDTSAISTGALPLARGGTGSTYGNTWKQENAALTVTIATSVWSKISSQTVTAHNGGWIFAGSVMFSNNSTGARGMLLSCDKSTATASFDNTTITTNGTRAGAGTAACVLSKVHIESGNFSQVSMYGWQNTGSNLTTVAKSLKSIYLGDIQT